jgi:serine protease Do
MTHGLTVHTLTRAVMTTLFMAGIAMPAAATEQPNTLSHPAAPGYFYIAGRAYLGVDIRDITTDRVSALKLKDERGAEITMLDADAPAGKAGLREHDVILEFNGTAIESEEQLRRLIREVPPGRTITLGISRDGSPMKVSLQLADHSAMVAPAVPHIPIIRIPDFPRNSIDIPLEIPTYSAILGVQTENLTRQLGEYFGVKNGEGVLVRSVEKIGAGEKAGLKAGDVIVRADNEKLTDRSDLNHILRSHRAAGKMTLVVMRDKHEQTIMVTLPDRGSRDSSRLNLGTLGLDAEDLQASLGNAKDLLQDLSANEGLLSLADNLATLNANAGLLNMAQHIQMTPEIEKAMQQAEKILEGLEIGSDPI